MLYDIYIHIIQVLKSNKSAFASPATYQETASDKNVYQAVQGHETAGIRNINLSAANQEPTI